MSSLYTRVFVQILDSSIAEDYTLRHIFEDFLKLCDYKTGIVDMTRQALSRRLNVPLDLLNESITKLEAPDPASRDMEFEGRRLERLDKHRDWGWRILNWEKYERIRIRASGAERAARYRDKKQEEENGVQEEQRLKKPSLEEIRLLAAKTGLPEAEANQFYNFYESKGWMVGKNPMKSPAHAVANWKLRWESNRSGPVENQL